MGSILLIGNRGQNASRIATVSSVPTPCAQNFTGHSCLTDSNLRPRSGKMPRSTAPVEKKRTTCEPKMWENRQIIHLFIGFSMIFTIHFGVPHHHNSMQSLGHLRPLHKSLNFIVPTKCVICNFEKV